MRFDRKKFFNGYRAELGHIAQLTQARVTALDGLLDFIEADPYLTRIEWPAYMLGTTMIETAYTFRPIHEYGGRAYFTRRYGSQTRKGRELGNDTPDEGWIYAGQGDVQLTGESNYEKAENALRKYYPELVAEFERRTGRKFDLTVGDQPNDLEDAKNAQDPAIAYAIMSFGMRTGMFTGKALPSNGGITKTWRAIINGKDRDEEIAGIAKKFQKILSESLIDMNTAEPNKTPLVIENALDGGNGTPDGKNGSDGQQTSGNTTQNADVIANVGTQVTETEKKVEAAKDTPDTHVEEQTKTGIVSKAGAFLMSIITGTIILPDWVTNGFNVGTFQLILNALDRWKYLIGGFIVVIYVMRKIESIEMRKKVVETNADPLKGNAVLIPKTGWLDTIRQKIGI